MPQARATVPEKGVRPIFAQGADIAAKVFVALNGSLTNDVPQATVPGAGATIYGVQITASVRANVSPDGGLPENEIGDAQVEGVAVVIASGAIVPGNPIATTAAGLAIVATTGDIVVGKGASIAADTEEAEIELAGPGQSYILP